MSIEYHSGNEYIAKTEKELTALTERIGEVATESQEATVLTHIDARVSGSVSTFLAESTVFTLREVGSPDDLLVERSNHLAPFIRRSVDGLLVERSNHEGHDEFG